jgi:pimeloyl-ACP methyl ester carboxylesterase
MCTSRIARRLLRLTVGCWLVMALSAEGQTAPIELRYKLKLGDRLTYREVFEKQGKSPDTTFHTRLVFSDQVVVLDSAGGQSIVGVQRNRHSADLLEYHEQGKDTLAAQNPGFLKRVAMRPIRFPDSNLFLADGRALLPLEVLREANSKLLYNIGEIMPLPTTAVQAGSEWELGIFGLRMRLDRFEAVGSESCAVFADAPSGKEDHLQFTFCPESGHMAKLRFEGRYREFDSTIDETVTFDLEGTEHDETPAKWLADPETRLGVLNALLVSTSPLPGAALMDEILKTGSQEAVAFVLADYYQRGIAPAQDALQPLLRNGDAEVRRIASRFAQPAQPAAQPCDVPLVSHGREKPGTTLRGMTTPAFAKLGYMIHIPLDYRGDRPFPVIFYLSGGGGLAFDAALSLPNVLKRGGYLVVLPNAGGQLWWESKPTEMVNALLLEVLRNYNVDTNRVYLTGFSNGGTAALEFGTRWPDRFAAIASLMGAGMNSPSGAKLPMQNLWDVPVLFLHGDKDPRIPSSASYTTYGELSNLKPRVAPEMHILKGRVHDVTLNTDEEFTLPFLERFVREPFPPAVTARIFDPRYPRQYWIEVAESSNGTAEVEARIVDAGLIDIGTRNVKQLRLLLRPELFHASGPLRVRLNGKELSAIELKRDCQLFQRSAESYVDPFLAYTDEVVLQVAP